MLTSVLWVAERSRQLIRRSFKMSYSVQEIFLRPETESSGTSISLYAGVRCLTQSVDTDQIASQLMTRECLRELCGSVA